MQDILALAAAPGAWAALATLIVMEIVLGIDNLIFLSILTNKLPRANRAKARAIGLTLALLMRLVLLGTISVIVRLTEPVIAPFDHPFSWRDIILIAGGLFLVWKATREIHESVDPHEPDVGAGSTRQAAAGFASALVQIVVLDLVFSIDSIVTAVGMTDHLPIMVVAVVIAVGAMGLASGPLSSFIRANPTIVMLALGFLLMIGMTLIADGFGFHVPKGYVYTAMAFSALVEGLNMLARRARRRRERADPAGSGTLAQARSGHRVEEMH